MKFAELIAGLKNNAITEELVLEKKRINTAEQTNDSKQDPESDIAEQLKILTNWDAFLDALASNTSLRGVSFLNCEIGSTRAIELVTAIAKNGHITALTLDNTHYYYTDKGTGNYSVYGTERQATVTADDIQQIAKILKDNTSLRVLKIPGHRISQLMDRKNLSDNARDELNKARERHRREKILTRQRVQEEKEITDKEISNIIALLAATPRLEELDISLNFLAEYHIMGLANQLETNKTTLRSLNLANNVLAADNDVGLIALCLALRTNTSLYTLVLSDTRMCNARRSWNHTDEASQALGILWRDALIQNKTLLNLNIHGLRLGAGIVHFCKGLSQNNALTTLNIRNNAFKDRPECYTAIANALKENQGLHMFDMRENLSTVKQTQEIIDALEVNKTLRELGLNLDEDNISCLAYFTATVSQHNTTLTTLFDQYNPYYIYGYLDTMHECKDEEVRKILQRNRNMQLAKTFRTTRLDCSNPNAEINSPSTTFITANSASSSTDLKDATIESKTVATQSSDQRPSIEFSRVDFATQMRAAKRKKAENALNMSSSSSATTSSNLTLNTSASSNSSSSSSSSSSATSETPQSSPSNTM